MPKDTFGNHILLVLLVLLLPISESFVPTTTSLQTYKKTESILLGTSKNTDASPVSLGFLSFDLDDTLFWTSRVVADANLVQIQRMKELGFDTTVSDFLDATRRIRQTLDMPITYTDLRKLTIREEMKRLAGDVEHTSLASLAEQCYDAWLEERHIAAERHLFADAIESLELIKLLYPETCVAAITNGRGNPLEMPNTLKPFFDFCVSGEDDDVFPNRKPHSGIYETALNRYETVYPHHCSSDKKHVWCHVGDCLANDVGASAACGAYAVWYYPEDDDGIELAASRLASTSGGTPSWSTASKSDIDRRSKLANDAKEKIAVRVSSLSELNDAISGLLEGASVDQLMWSGRT